LEQNPPSIPKNECSNTHFRPVIKIRSECIKKSCGVNEMKEKTQSLVAFQLG